MYGSPVEEKVPPIFARINEDKSCMLEFSSDATDLRRTCIGFSLNTLSLPAKFSCIYIHYPVMLVMLVVLDGISCMQNAKLSDFINLPMCLAEAINLPPKVGNQGRVPEENASMCAKHRCLLLCVSAAIDL